MNIDIIKKTSEDMAQHLGPDSDWVPVFFTETKTDMNMHFISPELLRDSQTKAFLARKMGEVIKEQKAISCAMIMTAWILNLEGKDVDLDNIPQPSQSPDRQEALTIMVFGGDGDSDGEQLEYSIITRRPGLHPLLGEWIAMPIEESGTIPMGIFPEAIMAALREVRDNLHPA